MGPGRTNRTEREYPHRELDDAPFLVVTQSVCCALLSLASSCRYYHQVGPIGSIAIPRNKILRRITIRQSIPASCLHDSSNSQPVPIAQLSIAGDQ